MPSILVELGFISNDAECKYLVSTKGIDEMGRSLYLSFQEYLDYYKKSMEKPATTASLESDNSTTLSVRPVYKVQFMSVKSALKRDDRRISSYQNVSYYVENELYKYTCGDTNDYNSILKTKSEVQKKYKDAFVIAFLDGKKISVAEARKFDSTK